MTLTRPPIGVGLLGAGWIAEIAHLRAILASPHARLIAAADRSPDRRGWLADRAAGVTVHEAWESVVSDGRVDAVVVALPTALHAAAARAALAAGKHLYLEKPLALSVIEGRAVVAEWRRAGTVGAIGYNFRRNPSFVHAARVVNRGDLGPLVTIQGSFQWAAPRIEGWRATPDAGGGALVDLLSHHVDLVLALSGDVPHTVRSTRRSVRAPDDTATIDVVMASGLTAQLVASSAAGAAVNQLDLVGREGRLRVNLLEPRPEPIERPAGRGARLERARQALAALHPVRLLRSPGAEPSFQATLEAFFEAIASGRPASPDLADGLRVLTVIEAAAESARRDGAPVPVEPVPVEPTGPSR